MDINVDTSIFSELNYYLNILKNNLQSASMELAEAVALAGASLEGKYYSLTVEETEQACKIINASVENIYLMQQYLNDLEDYANKYLECTYDGGGNE